MEEKEEDQTARGATALTTASLLEFPLQSHQVLKLPGFITTKFFYRSMTDADFYLIYPLFHKNKKEKKKNTRFERNLYFRTLELIIVTESNYVSWLTLIEAELRNIGFWKYIANGEDVTEEKKEISYCLLMRNHNAFL
ncbi:hypothetical protein BY996DRAFT_6427881 [Phakopsora pachyrhizi]|nr:hypothetical protein BY996DRAFT_6427881 [Phakopsora pachyrhizi]